MKTLPEIMYVKEVAPSHYYLQRFEFAKHFLILYLLIFTQYLFFTQ